MCTGGTGFWPMASCCRPQHVGMGQNETRGPQVLVHVSIYQGNPFWVPIFNPHPCHSRFAVFSPNFSSCDVIGTRRRTWDLVPLRPLEFRGRPALCPGVEGQGASSASAQSGAGGAAQGRTQIHGNRWVFAALGRKWQLSNDSCQWL